MESWLTTFTLLLGVLGVPRSHSSVMLLTRVLASVSAVAALVVVVALLLVGALFCCRCHPPVRRGCPGNRIWALPPLGLSKVALGL